MEDVAPKLYSQIRKLFDAAVGKDSQLKRVENRIRDGTATQKDVLLYSQRLGKHASEACKTVLVPENLPDGRLYYNIGLKRLSSSSPERRVIYRKGRSQRSLQKCGKA